MIFKNSKKEAQKLEQEEAPPTPPAKPEVKKPGMWSKMLDSFGAGNRWEKELAYIESQEEQETAEENEQATEAVVEMAHEVEAEVHTETTATVDEAERVIEEATADAPELLPDAETTLEETRQSQEEISAQIAELLSQLEDIDTNLESSSPKKTEYTYTGRGATVEYGNSNPKTEKEKTMEKQMAGIKGLIEKKFPGETIDDATADKIRIAIDAQNRRDGADYFSNAKKIIEAYHSTLEENSTIGQQIEKITSVLNESDENDIDKQILHAVRRKIHEWNIADNADYFDDKYQINEAFKQIKENFVIVEEDEVIEETEETSEENLGEVEQGQIKSIKEKLGGMFPNESVDDDISNKIRIIIDNQNRTDSADYFDDSNKITEAYNQVLEQNPTIKKQIELIVAEIGSGWPNNKTLHEVRRKIDEWNVADGANYFDNGDQIKEAFKQIDSEGHTRLIDLDDYSKKSNIEQESTPEKELQKYYDEAKESMVDLVISKSGSEDEQRKAIEDILSIDTVFNTVINDIKGNLALDVLQVQVEDLTKKNGLNQDKFSIFKFQDLIDKSENREPVVREVEAETLASIEATNSEETSMEDSSDKLYKEMKTALADLIINAPDEQSKREAIKDSLQMNGIIDSLINDINGNLAPDVMQEQMDNITTKHGLSTELFSVEKFNDALLDADKGDVNVVDLNDYKKQQENTNRPDVEAFSETVKIIEEAESFDDLIARIDENKITIKGSQQEFNHDMLKDIINKIRTREFGVDMATNQSGLREKISLLLESDSDMQSLGETLENVRHSLATESFVQGASPDHPLNKRRNELLRWESRLIKDMEKLKKQGVEML